MTLILAINLSDRIYLAADTLVSRRVGEKKEPAGYMMKLVSTSSEKSLIEASQKAVTEPRKLSTVSFMFAGNRLFVRYIFKCLSDGLDSEELSTDINELIKQIDPYLKKVVPKYDGPATSRVCKFIGAGCSTLPVSVKPFKLENLHNALGPEAGHIEDANAVHGLQFGFVNVPDQKTFSYTIDDREGTFGLDEVGEMYSVISGGSKKLSSEEKSNLLRYFLSKKNPEAEGMDIVNFMRNQFSDSIGGAVTLGYIDYRKRLIYFGYDLDKSGKLHHTNWSFRIENLPESFRFMATGPDGKEYDLIKGFYDFPGDFKDADLEL